MRTIMAGGCLAAARFVPFLAYVMSLIGSFLSISVSVICPAACHLSIFHVRACLFQFHPTRSRVKVLLCIVLFAIF